MLWTGVYNIIIKNSKTYKTKFKHSYKKLYKPNAWFILTCDHPPRQPPGQAQPCGPGMGSCLKRFCPRGRGAWQLKNNWYLLRVLDIHDVKHKNKNIETVPSRFFSWTENNEVFYFTSSVFSTRSFDQITSLLFCEVRVISRVVCTKLRNSRLRIFK